MAITAFLKVGKNDIAGESRTEGHEDEIDIHHLRWKLRSGRLSKKSSRRSRPRFSPLQVAKFVDASSPYLAAACHSARRFDRMELSVRDAAGYDHLVYNLGDVLITGYRVIDVEETGRVEERITLSYERIAISYRAVSDDGSPGERHEVELDSRRQA